MGQGQGQGRGRAGAGAGWQGQGRERAALQRRPEAEQGAALHAGTERGSSLACSLREGRGQPSPGGGAAWGEAPRAMSLSSVLFPVSLGASALGSQALHREGRQGPAEDTYSLVKATAHRHQAPLHVPASVTLLQAAT